MHGWLFIFFSFLVSEVFRVSHFSKPAGICWNLPLVSSLRSVEWRVYGVLFFTACLQQKVRALQLSSSTVFNYFGHVWSQLSCHLLPFVHVRCVFLHQKYKDHCKAFCRVADEVCPSGLRPWTVEADGLLCNSRLWEANGRKRCVEFDAVRSSNF